MENGSSPARHRPSPAATVFIRSKVNLLPARLQPSCMATTSTAHDERPYIDGQWENGDGVIEVRDLAEGGVFAQIAVASPLHAEAALDAAEAAQPAMADSTYSLRYDGRIQTETAGEYTFVLTTDSGTRLRIDGETVLDQWTRQGTGEETGTEDPWDQGTPRTERVTVELPAGARVPIRLDYRQPTPNAANLVLEWIPPTREEQTIADTQTWPTYLPAGTDWINFWTGERAQGGTTNTMDAPLDRLPLYAKAGAILPMGPVMEHTGAQPADPLEIRVYPGADGSFTLFEDAGDGMGYKEGEDYATIPFTWDDDAGALTIGEREGSFEGMLEERTLRIVWVGPDHGVGVETTPEADRVVTYDGTAQTVQR